jgi:hypothetical protein
MNVRKVETSRQLVARRMFLGSCSAAGGLATLASIKTAYSQESTEKDEEGSDKESIEKVDKLATRFADSTTFTIGDASHSRELHFENKAILRWSNPTAGKVFGADYVVVEKGVPRAYLSIYQWFSPYTDATSEMSSLTTEPISALRDQRKYWATTVPGTAFEKFTGAMAPASSANQRKSQMNKLASRFEFELTDTRGEKSGVKRQLRMLPKPVYQYQSQDPNVLDGAIFAFVEGTDPEALVTIQAEKEQEAFVYRYALIRRNSDDMSAKLDGVSVWHVPAVEAWKRNDQPYYQGDLNDIKAK